MTQKEKELLLKDLCARLPYDVNVLDDMGRTYKLQLGNAYLIDLFYGNGNYVEAPIRPYLRSMESMTDKEIGELRRICDDYNLRDECGDVDSTIYGMTVLYGEVEHVYPYDLKIKVSPKLNYDVLEYLIAHHFDYRGLISMGLALPATEDMYIIK